ncbi:PilZ domain-containing protein [Desulfurivibrio alkaliphilus]|uniref:Type IV pilus assembly PilZ n=1 Tax=Desulfurivibrio alkaliphilus (strain DSM 19089 / UNIQEM U267 / AHT2) TaxID=589865 RepID=D6Z705_DESAT|nr:PilZ domain-containing protein [Desulfurivibrio alkaliphilus]ADH86992.1 type IV pilus assembly PilZ [Desulfurivibrio alkaliphilus AHT 2]
MTTANRRHNSRVPFQATATLRFDHHTYEHCQTSDLSLKGVSVEGINGHQVGEQCRVELYLTGSTSNLRLQMKGEVVRVEQNGLALRLFAMDLDSFYHLKNIIAYNLGDPDQVEEEFSRQLEKPDTIV